MSLTRCARAALAVQAHGTPLAHKKYSVVFAGTPTFDMQVSSTRCARAVQAQGTPLVHNNGVANCSVRLLREDRIFSTCHYHAIIMN